jgi:putative drug exporter of the RND superfamily
VTLVSAPSSVATTNLVHRIRDTRLTLTAGTRADLSVTGITAVNIDVANRMSQALLPYLAVIAGLAFLRLAIACRSLLVPLTAGAGFLLSVAGSARRHGRRVPGRRQVPTCSGVSQTAPIDSLIPIVAIGIVFGFAMDYQVFLVSGMREPHAHGADPHTALRNGFRQSARVVTAAGLIMSSVFAGFILPDDPIIKSMGFALTTGVLIDAFLTLIPALMSLLGHRA